MKSWASLLKVALMMRARIPRSGLPLAALVLAASWPASAFAADEEIQVYLDDMDAPGEIGLDTHVNYVVTGDSTAGDYPGAEDSLHRLRVTPEFSYGITHNLEAGLYLPLMTVDRTGHFTIGGVKGRLKYVAHPGGNPNLWYGVNFELGRVTRRLDINPWNAELKGMAGLRTGRLLVAVNANIDFVVSGPAPAPASLEIASKLGYSLSDKVSVGIEGYNGVGPLKALGRFGSSDQTVLATADLSLGRWDVELGVGRGFATNPDRLIVKAIVSVPIDRLLHRR